MRHSFIRWIQNQIQIQWLGSWGLQRGGTCVLLEEAQSGAGFPGGGVNQADPLRSPLSQHSSSTHIHTCPGPSAAAAAALPPSLCGPVAMILCFFDRSSAAWVQKTGVLEVVSWDSGRMEAAG